MFNQRTIEIYRSRRPRGGDRRGVGSRVRAGRRDRVGRDAGRAGSSSTTSATSTRAYEPLSPSPRLFVTPDRARADPPPPSRRARRAPRVRDGARLARAGRRRRDARASRAATTGAERTVRARYVVAADGSKSPVRERLGIPLRGHPSFSNSITIYFRADVKPLHRRPQPERDLRVRPDAAGVLPLLVGGRRRLPRRQHDDQRRRNPQPRRLGGHERRALRRVRARGARRAGSARSRSRTCSSGTPAPSGPSGSRTGRVFLAGDAAHNMPPDRRLRREHRRRGRAQPRLEARARARRQRRGRGCSTPTTPSGARSASSRPSRRTRATSSGSIPSSARTTSSRSSRTRRSSSATATARLPWSPRATTTARSTRTRASRRAARERARRTSSSTAARRSTSSGATSSSSPPRTPGVGAAEARVARTPIGSRRRRSRRPTAPGRGRRARPSRRVHRLAGARAHRDGERELSSALARILDR